MGEKHLKNIPCVVYSVQCTKHSNKQIIQQTLDLFLLTTGFISHYFTESRGNYSYASTQRQISRNPSLQSLKIGMYNLGKESKIDNRRTDKFRKEKCRNDKCKKNKCRKDKCRIDKCRKNKCRKHKCRKDKCRKYK